MVLLNETTGSLHYSGEGHLIEGEIEGDPNRTVRPIVCDADGHLVIDLDASTITIGTVQIEATNGDILTSTNGSLNVNVTDFPAIQTVTAEKSTDAIGTVETVFSTVTPLLASNGLRKGLIIQIQNETIEVWLGTTSVPTYVLSPKSILEIENFTGALFGRTLSGSTSVYVTEKF